MAKWAGKIGFQTTEEVSLGVWEEKIIERQYYGDVMKNYRNLDNNSEINNSVSISNQISFVVDPYANENFHNIRYTYFMGTKWRVTNIEVQYPRLIMNLGGVWNGQEGGAPQCSC